MDNQVISSLIAVVGTLAGSVLGIISTREAKKVGRLERKIERYKNDIRARQAEEQIAARWLCELGIAPTEVAAKIKLRERTEQETGLRPEIPPNGIRINA